MAKSITKRCVRCNEEMTVKSAQTQYCLKCRKEITNERKKQANKSANIKPAVVNDEMPTKRTYSEVYKDVRKVLFELERYNKEHRTHLTYGQYVNMLYLEDLKIRAIKKKKRGRRK